MINESSSALEILNQQGIDKVVNSTMETLLNFIPGAIAAIVIFIIGWLISVLVSRILKKFLEIINVERFLERHRLSGALGNVKLTDMLVGIVKYYLIIIFLQAAISFLNLATITSFMDSVIQYLPTLIGAILTIIASMFIGEYLKEKIMDVSETSAIIHFAGRGTKALVIYIGINMGLSTAGFDTTIITTSFVTILQAIVYGIALGVGIAFGLGGQEDAKEMIRKVREGLEI